MTELQATPYVPGHAQGMLQRGSRDASAKSICMLTQQELGAIDERPNGIIVIDGAMFSHPMIRLLTLGIPTVIVTKNIADSLEVGQEVCIDGLEGKILQPAPDALEHTPGAEPLPAGGALKFADGSEVLLRASVFSTEDAARAVQGGAAAIGLVRTEYMIPDSHTLPDAAYFESTLGALCNAAQPLTVTLRLPDIAQDKPVPWIEPHERTNTPLAMQGVRLFDKEPVRRVVYALLDAVNTLAADFSIRLLLPYVTQLEEFQRWRERIEQHLDQDVPVGTMAESPAAVLALPHWFEHADFVAIGCNDLMQCFFAADRDLAEMRTYLDAYSPELFRFLQQAASAAGSHISRLQLCGLLPQLPGVLPVLLGMGFRVFSVAPVMIPYLAEAVNRTDLPRAQALARRVCEAKDSRAVRDLL